MLDSALSLFESLSTYDDLQELIDNGETEGLYLECKAPSGPRLNKGLKVELAKSVSGFSNTEGGVIIWGMSTTKHSHSGLDVLTQLEPIGNCKLFEKQVETAIPLLTTPAVFGTKTKIIKERPKDTKGIVITYISKFGGDPVQSNEDDKFYFRGGDGFHPAPYEMIKRLFASSESPDIRPLPVDELVKLGDDGVWQIPIGITNYSTAIGEHVVVHVTILNPSACELISADWGFSDVSHLNPGKTMYSGHVNSVVYRGMNTVIGNLFVKMKVDKLPKRALKFKIAVFANKMRAREIELTLRLAKSKFTIEKLDERFLY